MTIKCIQCGRFVSSTLREYYCQYCYCEAGLTKKNQVRWFHICCGEYCLDYSDQQFSIFICDDDYDETEHNIEGNYSIKELHSLAEILMTFD
jgi:hypothetical protein